MSTVDSIISHYRPITLEQMSGIKLMNRTDTKFVTSVAKLCRLLEMASAEYFAQDIDGERNAPYYTVYFDTPRQRMYTMHHNGHLNRQKVRVRSYVSSHLNFLEVKTKDNHGRTKKKRVDVPGFDPLNPDRSLAFGPQQQQYGELTQFLAKKLFVCRPDELSQQLENRFRRVTLVNSARTERLTIDTELRFHNLLSGHRHDLTGLAIIELKRDGLQHSPILEMLRVLRIKPQGFSKYCMGAAFTGEGLKINRFKLRLHIVERLMADND